MKEFNKVKAEIVHKYLKENSLHETKKEAIRIFLKKYENFINDFGASMSHTAIEEMMAAYLDDTEETISRIIQFKDNDLLDTVNYYASFEDKINFLFYLSFFDFYDNYTFFVNSKIDESNYLKKIKSLKKMKCELQKFSKQEIQLDNLPQHPAYSIKDFCINLTNLSNEQKLSFINIIILKLSDKQYSKLPKPTKIFENTLHLVKKLQPYMEQNIQGKLSNDDFKNIFNELSKNL